MNLLYPVTFTAAIDSNTWEIARGALQTYNVADLSTETQTGWTLVNPPTGFTINDVGVISVHLDWDYTGTPGDITVETDQDVFVIPTSVVTFFPGDFVFPPTTFYSATRSYDRSARELWVGTYTYEDSLGQLNQLDQNFVVSSEDDGYLSIPNLRTRLNAINPNGVLWVDTIRDQLGNFDLRDIGNANSEFLAIYMDGGAISTARRHNGRLLFQSVWDPTTFGTQGWTGAARTGAIYEADSNDQSLLDAYALIMFLEKEGANSEGRYLRCGDGNLFPGFKNNNTGWRFSTRSPITPYNPGEMATPEMFLGHQWNNGADEWNRRFFRYALSDTPVVDFTSTSTAALNSHDGTGASMEMNRYYWGEMAFYDYGDSLADRILWNDNQLTLANDYLRNILGIDAEYT